MLRPLSAFFKSPFSTGDPPLGGGAARLYYAHVLAGRDSTSEPRRAPHLTSQGTEVSGFHLGTRTQDGAFARERLNRRIEMERTWADIGPPYSLEGDCPAPEDEWRPQS